MWLLLAQIVLVLVICIAFGIVVIAALWVTLDCDITLWLATYLGKSPRLLKGRVVWVTGASSGIGEELAYKLAESGCKLVLSGRDEAKLDIVRNKCLTFQLQEDDVLVLPFDMLNVDSHQAQLDKVLAHFQSIDILANNAGRSQRAMFHETSLEVDEELFSVNVFSLINLTRVVLNYWLSNNKRGHLVVTSSTTGKFGVPNSASYCASKHALHGYFESIRYEVYNKGIDITMICPGPVFSDLIKRAFTGTPGETYGLVHGADSKRMPAARCAELIALAIANNLNEAWICLQPILSLYFANQYLPAVSKWVLPRYLSMDRISRFREGTTTTAAVGGGVESVAVQRV